jgi:hypothetical protein
LLGVVVALEDFRAPVLVEAVALLPALCQFFLTILMLS